MANKGYITSETTYCIILYTTRGKTITTYLTKSAKRQLMAQLGYTNSLPKLKGTLAILDKRGKKLYNIPIKSLRPFIQEIKTK